MTTLIDEIRLWIATQEGYAKGETVTTGALRRIVERHEADAATLAGIINSAYGTDAVHTQIGKALVEAGWVGPLTPEILAAHVPIINEDGYPVLCTCGDGTAREPFHRDEHGNRLKDDEPARQWAAHVMEAIRS